MGKKKAKTNQDNKPVEIENAGAKPRPLIPAYRDTLVHFLFATPGNEPILLHFLNSVLESDGQAFARSVVAKNPFNPATFVTDKYSIIDVKATDERGGIFVVEFQTSEKAAFPERMTYYGSRAFGGQMASGDSYTSLREVLSIAVTTFVMFPTLWSIHNSFRLTAKADPNVVFTNLLQMHVLEAAEEKIDRAEELPPRLAAWVNFFFFSHLKSEDEMSTLLKGHPELEQAYEKYLQFNNDEELRALDEAHQRFLHDLATDIEAAHDQGVGEGIAIGVDKGIEIGEVRGEIKTTLRFRFGDVPEDLAKRLSAINDLPTLTNLDKLASSCATLAEFAEAMK